MSRILPATSLIACDGDDADDRRAPKQRQDYTAGQLSYMARLAADGVPPAGSVADCLIRKYELAGDFATALGLREEVKERAPDLARLARAQAKADMRAKRRKARA